LTDKKAIKVVKNIICEKYLTSDVSYDPRQLKSLVVRFIENKENQKSGRK
jgi:hypothetical protein